MSFDFKGRRVVVTGASRGIGRSIALEFAAAGAAVSICARGADKLEATRQEIARHGSKTHGAVCDLADGADVARYVESAATALGGIDILVNNASGYGQTEEEANWAACIAVDLLATARASRAAEPFLERTGPGSSIVNISSISGLHATPSDAPYGAVKAALIQYTATQAVSLAPKRIRANGVAPGSIEFSRRLLGSDAHAGSRGLSPGHGPHGLQPSRTAGGGGPGGALPRLAAGLLDHRPDRRRGWRAEPRIVSCRRNSLANFWGRQATRINNLCPAATENLVRRISESGH